MHIQSDQKVSVHYFLYFNHQMHRDFLITLYFKYFYVCWWVSALSNEPNSARYFGPFALTPGQSHSPKCDLRFLPKNRATTAIIIKIIQNNTEQ